MSFQAVADQISSLGKAKQLDIPDKDLLILYALYKQGTVGDVNTERPGWTDFKGKAKWDAWSEKKGLPQQVAQAEYVKHGNHCIQAHKK